MKLTRMEARKVGEGEGGAQKRTRNGRQQTRSRTFISFNRNSNNKLT